MKHRFLSLLLASMALLLLIMGCELLQGPRYYKNPVYAVIDGVQYEAEEQRSGFLYKNQRPELVIHNDYFYFILGQWMVSGEKYRHVCIRALSYEPHEFHKPYPLFLETVKDEHDNFVTSPSFVSKWVDGQQRIVYDAISGWIEFTDSTRAGNTVYLSGKFEFDAKERDGEEIIKVTEGRFGPMKIHFSGRKPTTEP